MKLAYRICLLVFAMILVAVIMNGIVNGGEPFTGQHHSETVRAAIAALDDGRQERSQAPPQSTADPNVREKPFQLIYIGSNGQSGPMLQWLTRPQTAAMQSILSQCEVVPFLAGTNDARVQEKHRDILAETGGYPSLSLVDFDGSGRDGGRWATWIEGRTPSEYDLAREIQMVMAAGGQARLEAIRNGTAPPPAMNIQDAVQHGGGAAESLYPDTIVSPSVQSGFTYQGGPVAGPFNRDGGLFNPQVDINQPPGGFGVNANATARVEPSTMLGALIGLGLICFTILAATIGGVWLYTRGITDRPEDVDEVFEE